MIGLDTNVLVRYLTDDDPEQSALSHQLIDGLSAEQPGFVSLVTMVEVGWVLSHAYDLDRPTVASILQGLLDAPELRIELESTVRQALVAVRGGAEFSDAVIAGCGRRAGCERVLTFDRRVARAAGMELLGG